MSAHHRASWSSAESRRWRKRLEPEVKAGNGVCVDCGRGINPDDPRWQVGHVVPLSQGGTPTADNLGPSHSNGSGPAGRSCNQSAGGRLGSDKTNATKRKEKRRFEW